MNESRYKRSFRKILEKFLNLHKKLRKIENLKFLIRIFREIDIQKTAIKPLQYNDPFLPDRNVFLNIEVRTKLPRVKEKLISI